MRDAIQLARKVAMTSTTVLITGETGTGKEVFARSIHQESLRKNKPFVAINCSAFGKELLESEMFGHRAGAFTGATKDKKGLFEEADKGTLFLDELGEMPLDMQAKLLRALEQGEFLKVGDNKPTRVDIRFVAATNRDLRKEVALGHFREDLFYRISVFQISLPPLRERLSDIPLFATSFLEKFARQQGKKHKGFAADCLETLSGHPWKGNVRELKNVIERGVVLMDNGGHFDIGCLPLEMHAGAKQAAAPSDGLQLADAEKAHIQKVLSITNGNKTKAAELLGIALTTLYRKLEERG